MRTAIVGFLLAIFLAGYHGQQKYPQATNVQKAGEQAPPTPISSVASPTSEKQKLSAYQETKAYLCRAFGPESLATWVLVIAAGIGLYVTWRTAKAALLNAEVAIDSTRAWITVEIGELPNFQPSADSLEFLWIFPTIQNKGKTPARIKRIAGILKLIPSGQQLPTVPEYILGQGFDQRIDVILPPDSPIRPRLGISGQEFIDIQNGELSLFVHGFVEYMDGVSQKARKTSYIFSYVVQSGFSPAEAGFYPYLDAPREYTECT